MLSTKSSMNNSQTIQVILDIPINKRGVIYRNWVALKQDVCVWKHLKQKKDLRVYNVPFLLLKFIIEDLVNKKKQKIGNIVSESFTNDDVHKFLNFVEATLILHL